MAGDRDSGGIGGIVVAALRTVAGAALARILLGIAGALVASWLAVNKAPEKVLPADRLQEIARPLKFDANDANEMRRQIEQDRRKEIAELRTWMEHHIEGRNDRRQVVNEKVAVVRNQCNACIARINSVEEAVHDLRLQIER